MSIRSIEILNAKLFCKNVGIKLRQGRFDKDGWCIKFIKNIRRIDIEIEIYPDECWWDNKEID